MNSVNQHWYRLNTQCWHSISVRCNTDHKRSYNVKSHWKVQGCNFTHEKVWKRLISVLLHLNTFYVMCQRPGFLVNMSGTSTILRENSHLDMFERVHIFWKIISWLSHVYQKSWPLRHIFPLSGEDDDDGENRNDSSKQ